MNKTEKLEKLRADALQLKEEYSETLLLDIVKRHKAILDADEVQNRMFIEATQDLLEKLEENETTVESFYTDIDTCLGKYEKWLTEYRKEHLPYALESALRVHMALPIDLLLVLYIINHPEYKSGFDIWEFDEQLEPFVNALKGE